MVRAVEVDVRKSKDVVLLIALDARTVGIVVASVELREYQLVEPVVDQQHLLVGS